MDNRLPLSCTGDQYAAATIQQQDDFWKRLVASWRQNAEREMQADCQYDHAAAVAEQDPWIDEQGGDL